MAAATASDVTCSRSFRMGFAARPGGVAVSTRSATRRGRGGAGTAVRDLWAWLTGTAYRPERHYMRGGRTATGPTLGGDGARGNPAGAGWPLSAALLRSPAGGAGPRCADGGIAP